MMGGYGMGFGVMDPAYGNIINIIEMQQQLVESRVQGRNQFLKVLPANGAKLREWGRGGRRRSRRSTSAVGR